MMATTVLSKGDAPAHDGWPLSACAATAALLAPRGIASRSAIWSTLRTRYDDVGLPDVFRIRTVGVLGAWRRLATCEGASPRIVIVPGMFASLHQRLFVDIADAARSSGRAVTLVEDRFAGPTIELNGPKLPTAHELTLELGAIIAEEEEPPDLIALSAGALAALFLRQRVRRMVAWSAAFRPSAVLAQAERAYFVRRHFDRERREAFRSVRRAAPSTHEIADALSADDGAAFVDAPLLLVHAEDDPVAPVSQVRRARDSLRLGQRACIVPHGGHLGFGLGRGAGIYLAPLGVDPKPRRTAMVGATIAATAAEVRA